MSNSSIFKDFYQVPNIKFDISKLRTDLDNVLKKSKYTTLGITNFHAIPMNQIPNRISELDPKNNYVIMCRTGVRSSQICEFLIKQNFESISNLTGGINEWAKKIDSSIPIY